MILQQQLSRPGPRRGRARGAVDNVDGSKMPEGGQVQVAGGAATAGAVHLLLESRFATPEGMCSRSKGGGFNELVA
jgi:hypothetical protein